MNDEMKTTLSTDSNGAPKLQPGFGKMSVFAFSIGTSIGWGSLVVTCNSYLAQAGVVGTILGLLIGMIVIFVITRNLRYMIERNQNAGGIYYFARKVCGYDYGFLAAWFLLLTYMSILWANTTSVPLFVRYFFGDTFQFGYLYTIFGYKVYLGEVLLSVAAIGLAGLVCAFLRKTTNVIMTVSALTFVVGFVFCTVWALLSHDGSTYSYDPSFVPDSSALSQITKIAVISPWAFIGFENITHFSEEYTFKAKKIRKILIISVALTTAVYIFVTLLSVSAYPPQHASWLDYIKYIGDPANRDSISGWEAVPAFYAINHYLGNTGVVILMLSLFGAIVTSLIGNTMALSRLMFAAGREGSAPRRLTRLSKKGNPVFAIFVVVGISMLIPFIGRTAIGWIVDITTLGATIIYGLVSFAVFKDARRENLRTPQITGISGLVLMLVFVMLILLPNLFFSSAMATEAYILFDIWAILGIIYFRRLVIQDKERQYGSSVLVWIILLLFVLFASMMWVAQKTQSITNTAMGEIAARLNSPDVTEYLQEKSREIQNSNALYTIASFTAFIGPAAIIFSNYQIMKKREKEYSSELLVAKKKAGTDQLTGIRNRHAYSYKEQELDSLIDSGELENLAIIVCDINDLKVVNDQKGHNGGDKCIKMTSALICDTFKHSAVFRIGGDEFAVMIDGGDYENRNELIEKLIKASVEREEEIGSTLAAGMSEYIKGEDESVLKVFSRADERMYMNKTEMKSGKPAR